MVDDASLPELPKTGEPPAAPLVVVATPGGGIAALRERTDLAEVVAVGEGDFSGRLSLRLAEVLFRTFPSDLLAVLPEGLSADQRLIIAWAARTGLRLAVGSGASERQEWRRTVIERMAGEEIEKPAEILSGIELWLPFRLARERRWLLPRAVKEVFPEPASYETVCVQTVGHRPAALLEQGGEPALLVCLRERWREARAGEARQVRTFSEKDLDLYRALYLRFRPVAFRAARAAGASACDSDETADQILAEGYEKGPEFWRRDHKASYIAQRARWHVSDHRKKKEQTAVSLFAPGVLDAVTVGNAPMSRGAA